MAARKQCFVVFIEQTDGYGPLLQEVRALDEGQGFDEASS